MLWLAFSFLFGETVPFCLAVIYLNRFHWCEYKGRPFVWPPDKTSTWFVWAALIIIRHGALCFIRGFWVFVQNAHVLIYLFYMQRQNSVEETLTYRNGNDITGTPYSFTVFSTYVSLSGCHPRTWSRHCCNTRKAEQTVQSWKTCVLALGMVPCANGGMEKWYLS